MGEIDTVCIIVALLILRRGDAGAQARGASLGSLLGVKLNVLMESSLVFAPALLGNTIGASSDGFVIAEWQDAGGSATERRLIAPVHLHYKDDEAWYVLEGRLRVQIGENEVEAGAGSAVFVPRGTRHTYWNPGPERVRYLLIMTSNIYRLIQEIHAIPDKSPAILQDLFRKFESELF